MSYHLQKPFRVLSVGVAAVVLATLLCHPARAGSPLTEASGSLALAPADVAIYSSSLRNREQIEIVTGSKAWNELKNMPFVQMGLMMAQMQLQQPDSPLPQIQQFFQEPENQQLLEVLGDMVSDEVFFYAGQDLSDVLLLLVELNGVQQFAPLGALMSGNVESVNEAKLAAVLEFLAEESDRIKIPEVVIGFKTTKPEAARAQLARLEQFLTAILAEKPELGQRLERITLGEAEYLTFQLDGSMVPWDEIASEDAALDDKMSDEIDRLIDHLKDLKGAVTLGLHGDYVILSLGGSNEHLAKLGQGAVLADREELARLAPHAEERLIGIGFVNEALLRSISNTKQDIDNLVEMADELLPMAELDPELERRISQDVASLGDDLKEYVPEPGALVGCSFLTFAGIESYQYNWTDIPWFDTSKRLKLLNHVGGTPLLAYVSRAKYSPESYEMLVKWLKKAHQYFEQFALPEMKDSEREEYEQFMGLAKPLLVRLDKATGTMLVPALADGESGIVLDAKMKSRQWLAHLPATHDELPMVQLALVFGVSDRALLEQAMNEYWSILNGALQIASELSEGELPPNLRVPDPQVRQTDSGTIYSFPLPEAAGLDAQIALTGALDETVAALTIAPDHAERLLTETPLDSSGPLADVDRELGSALLIDFAGMIDAIEPWIEFGVRMASDESGMGSPENDSPQTQQILSQVRTGLKILRVFNSSRLVTYEEDGVLVTHGELRIIDLE